MDQPRYSNVASFVSDTVSNKLYYYITLHKLYVIHYNSPFL